MSEWSKEHAWKVCIPQKGIKGSNPFSSAIEPKNDAPAKRGCTDEWKSKRTCAVKSFYSSVQNMQGMGAFFGGGDCREPAGRQGKNKRRSGAVNPGQEFQLTGSERNKGVVNPAFENFS